ncbi:MAG: SdiA-regulated domain-containing protein [Flavobacteriales bacterium]|nr:SdiA-regulated domain-containing protein [Flavobacteriales bacterium]
MPILISVAFFIVLNAEGQISKISTLKPEKRIRLSIPEPSDLAWWQGAWYVVSDNGWLYRCTPDFSDCQKTPVKGVDFEALAASPQALFVSEESLRLVHCYDRQLNLLRSWRLPDHGPLNAGAEALAWDEQHQTLLAVTESPVTIYAIRDEGILPAERRWPYRGDISAAVVHQGDLWLLSDESRMIYQISPSDYHVRQIYGVPVVNPEGLAFDQFGNLLVLSDDRQTVYYFRIAQ